MIKTLLLMFSTMAAFAADLSGCYVLDGVHEVASELDLKPDGTFEYVFIHGAADYQAKGTWRQDGNAVVLTTEGDGKPFRLLKTAKAPGGEFRVSVKAPNGRGVEHISVIADSAEGKLQVRTDGEGRAEFPGSREIRAVQFRVPVYDVTDGPYTVPAGATELTFEINGEAITRVPFKGERLLIGASELEMRFWNPNPVMKYRRQ